MPVINSYKMARKNFEMISPTKNTRYNFFTSEFIQWNN